eukprot:4425146-Amphidinium_carterae.1
MRVRCALDRCGSTCKDAFSCDFNSRSVALRSLGHFAQCAVVQQHNNTKAPNLAASEYMRLYVQQLCLSQNAHPHRHTHTHTRVGRIIKWIVASVRCSRIHLSSDSNDAASLRTSMEEMLQNLVRQVKTCLRSCSTCARNTKGQSSKSAVGG